MGKDRVESEVYHHPQPPPGYIRFKTEVSGMDIDLRGRPIILDLPIEVFDHIVDILIQRGMLSEVARVALAQILNRRP